MDFTPHYIIEICAAIIIAVLSISYPFIANNISKIGDKYHSQYIPVIFETEFPQRTIKYRLWWGKKQYSISWFRLSLYAALCSFILLIFSFPPPFGWDNWFINNSAEYLVLLLTSILILLFFKWGDKIVLYNGQAKKLLKHIIKQYSLKGKDDPDSYHLKAINEMSIYAFENQNPHLQETLLGFYYKMLNEFREKNIGETPIKYISDIYDITNKICEAAASIDNRKLDGIQHRAVSGLWLLGDDMREIPVSKETYQNLWHNLYTVCNKPELIEIFWSNSNQYFSHRLREIFEYSFNSKTEEEQKNIKTIVSNRNKERKQFLEFHYALGGLVLYKKHYALIKYMFEFSQTTPSESVLLPKNMTDIFTWFMHFANDSTIDNLPFDMRYYFPGLNNLGNSKQITDWICRYIVILFIRKYQFQKELPILPKEVDKLNMWRTNIPFFEKCLTHILKDKTLLTKLNIDEEVNNPIGFNKPKHSYTGYVTQLREAIISQIGHIKRTAPLSPEKVKAFKNASSKVIVDAIDEFKDIFNHSTTITDCDFVQRLSGASAQASKNIFIKDEGTHFVEYDSFYAKHVALNSITNIIPTTFNSARTESYLLNEKNIILGLNRIISKRTDLVIVGINLNNDLKKEIKSNSNASLECINPGSNRASSTLFVLNKTDLPVKQYGKPDDDMIQDFELSTLKDYPKIYTGIVDFYTKEGKKLIKKRNLYVTDEEDNPKVLMTVQFVLELHWKKNRRIIQIDIATQYEEQGIQTDINDVKPLE